MNKERFKPIVDLHLFLLNENNEILLMRRFNTGYEDGKYSVPAGHLEPNETLATGIIREAKEEINIDISNNDILMCHIMHNLSDSPRIGFFFNAKKWQGTIHNLETNKCDEIKWFHLTNIPTNTVAYVKYAIDMGINQDVIYSNFGWS